FLDDQQTHCLPGNDEDVAWIARSLGMSCDPNSRRPDAESCELLDQLCAVREIVATEFDALLHDGQAPKSGAIGCRTCGGPVMTVDAE
ncbi:hypothetical protein ACVBEH_29350, partial [Roseateles sp. GG27B]